MRERTPRRSRRNFVAVELKSEKKECEKKENSTCAEKDTNFKSEKKMT